MPGGRALSGASSTPPLLRWRRSARDVSADFGGGAIFEQFFAPGRPGHLHFDLEAYVAHRLEAAGIGSIHRAGQDTLSQPDRYFSYRRATLAGEPGYGRQISIIALP